jgi:hypothetical protein
MRDAIALQSYQRFSPPTITPRPFSVKSNVRRIAFDLCRTLCRAARFSRMMIAPAALFADRRSLHE